VDVQTGFDESRPAYQRVLTAVRAGQVDLLLLWKYDRLGRDDGEYISRANELVRRRIRIVSVVEDENPPFVIKLMGLLANEESANTSKRVIANMRTRAEMGYWTNRAPFGYLVVRIGDDGKYATLVPDPLTALVVRELFEMASRGEMGLPALVQWLNVQKDTAGNPLRPLQGLVFTWRTVRHMLTNPTYVGMVRRVQQRSKLEERRVLPADEQIWVQGKHEALVSRELFDNVQVMLASRRGRSHGNVPSGRYLLTGLVRCGVCSRRMRGHLLRRASWPESRKPDAQYRCDQLGHGSVGMRWLDAWVEACVGRLPITETTVALVDTYYAERDTVSPARIERLQAERDELERKLSALTDLLLADPNPIVRRTFDRKSEETQCPHRGD
jgi:site-specific DNA recombinase